MNFKILSEKKDLQKPVLIGKTGMLRLRKYHSNLFGFDNGEKWICGVDLEESNPKNIYFFKASEENKHLAKKMKFINTSWTYDVKLIIQEFKLKIPLKCAIEPYKDSDYEGFRLKIA